jgi:putative FmdB family regulatory protein
MPIYEYECKSCGHRLEALQKIDDPVLVDCPVCGKVELRKLLSAPGFQLKGTGWYATDFKGSGSKPEKSEKSDTASPKKEPEGGCGSGGCGGAN